MPESSGRLDRLEAVVESITAGMASLKETVAEIARDLNKVGKMSGGVVVSIVATALSAVGVLLVIGKMALAPMQRQIDELGERLSEHKSLPGHFEAMRLHAAYTGKFETIREKIDAVDARVDENYRLLNSMTDNRFYKSDWERNYDVVIQPLEERVRALESPDSP